MPSLRLIIAVLALLFASVLHAEEAQTTIVYAGTWLSVVPPLLAIAVALLFRQVIPALFVGLMFGVWLIGNLSWQALWTSPLVTVQKYTVDALADTDHASVIIFSLLIGGLVGISSRNGGMVGVVNLIVNWANSVKRASLATIAMGLSIFFDDYANSLVVGNTMRPVTDKMKISREKLAYLVDSTAAPIASIAFVTTWVGFEVGLIDEALRSINHQGDGAYIMFLQSIPYSFYPIFAIALTIFIASTGRDFGPMLNAEQRAREGYINTTEGIGLADDDIQPIEDKPHRAMNALIPFGVLILVVLGGLYVTGLDPNDESQKLKDIIGNSDAFKAMLWASIAATLVAIVMSVSQRILTMEDTMEAWYEGMKPMLQAIVILVLAWSLAAITEQLKTSLYISSLLQDSLSYYWLPVLTFLLAALTAFATGSSWGTMGILIPLIIPITWNVMSAQGVLDAEYLHIIHISIASILAGAVWGDHCSPISDTTILSSMASGCDHIEHVRTQIPYAMYAGGFAILIGIIPASFGLSPWIALAIGLVAMYAGLRWLGTKV
ncbi:MAG: Na+/H+ antiporter NhaC family protein [Proteobacteria bacterium]|nr:MAG: Na+/H+ antiporter NhaC family protein [Pseudomonadota bacterium]